MKPQPWTFFIAALLLLHTASSSSPSSLSRAESFASFECGTCLKMLSLVDHVATSRITQDLAEDIAIAYCRINHGGLGWPCKGTWQCKDMCNGIIESFAPVVLEAGTKAKLDPLKTCRKMRVCPREGVADDDLAAHQTNLYQVSPANIIEAPSSPQAETLRVIQISDVHLDRAYSVGSDTECGQPLCARDPDTAGPTRERSAGYYGDYAGDTPVQLLDSLLVKISSLKPDMIVFTGDTSPHNVWRQSRKFDIDELTYFTRSLKTLLPEVPVFPVFGNHAAFPVNQFNTDVSIDAEWLYKPIANQWADWLPDYAIETLGKFGYYSALVPGHPKLRMIGLNTNLHNRNDFWLWAGDDDWADMFAWLERLLDEHNESFYVLGHHPPQSCVDLYRDTLYRILLKHRDRFVGAFWGHTHDDTFAVLMDDSSPSIPVAVQYTAASVTTFGEHNPSFRSYELDMSTYHVLDYDQYRVDMEAQKLLHEQSPNVKPSWQIAYSAKEAYGLDSMSPNQMLSLIDRMKTDDFLLSYYFLQRSTGHQNTPVDPQTREDAICEALSFTSKQRDSCHLI